LLLAKTRLEVDVFLTICGEGESGYVSSLKAMLQELGLDSKVHFLGHIDGEEKSRVFWNSDVTVVPSFTENFGMVVVESLSHGVPVIASRGTPWKRIVEYDCGLWVDNAPALLAKEITSIRNRDLNQMGLNGRKWMEEEFSWIKIAERMQSVYTQLADNTRHDCK
jgi:glycosyltransferase involved in cell wall biosynthesis